MQTISLYRYVMKDIKSNEETGRRVTYSGELECSSRQVETGRGWSPLLCAALPRPANCGLPNRSVVMSTFPRRPPSPQKETQDEQASLRS